MLSNKFSSKLEDRRKIHCYLSVTMDLKLVPDARFELARQNLASDFKSEVSADSTNRANFYIIQEKIFLSSVLHVNLCKFFF